MTLPDEILRLLRIPAPLDLGPGPRSGLQPAADIKALLGRCDVPESHRDIAFAALLLWQDHLDDAHGIVQEMESADGNYLHAILHRREPDYANAKYWFRRVGRHRGYNELAGRIVTFLKPTSGSTQAETILPGGKWDALHFVDLCEAAVRDAGADAAVLREVQRLEFEVLLEQLWFTP